LAPISTPSIFVEAICTVGGTVFPVRGVCGGVFPSSSRNGLSSPEGILFILAAVVVVVESSDSISWGMIRFSINYEDTTNRKKRDLRIDSSKVFQ
jgi:hypothetical protein